MAPSCSVCRADAIGFLIPSALASNVPIETPAASCCRVCLTIDPLESLPDDQPPLSTISDAFPRDVSSSAGVALLVGLLESLALHRGDIQAVVDHLEESGVDALLVLEELAADPTLSPAIDLDRRLHQLQQLLE